VRRSAIAWPVLGAAVALTFGCGGARASSATPSPPSSASAAAQQAPDKAFPSEADAGVPLSGHNPAWGSRTALVTIVEFADFQCPYCAGSEPALARVREVYGPGVVRVVWMNYPLPFHRQARPAAEAAMGVFSLAGADAFWKFYRSAFESKALDDASFETWARAAGVADVAAWHAGLASHSWAGAVDADMAEADALGVRGTPTFFVNGVAVVGQQSFEELKGVVDEQVAAAKAKLAAGTPPERLYAELSRENRAKAPKEQDEDQEPPEDTKTVFKIPVDRSPQRGSKKALVTIVEFADYQCPYCAAAEPMLASLRKKYGDDLRIVFKDLPLDFHDHAEPAAEAALEVRAEKGDAAFWSMHDALFTHHASLADDSLVKLATDLGARPDAVRAAITKHTHSREIDEDLALADDFGVAGTPNFFINGRHLVGLQAQEKFEAIIDEEVKRARALLGQPGVKAEGIYDALIASGKGADPPERRALPSLPAGDPGRGAADAKVVIHEWADFECPFCARVEPTLERILAEYRGKVRIVWHDLPLPMHHDAPGAAEAAREALRQKGEAGFWAIHDTLFENQQKLARADLDGYASALKLDMKAWGAALDGAKHQAELDADVAAAHGATISGTPAFLVAPRGSTDGYFLSGAQPWLKFRKLVERALAEAK
jgi:protein-disulfide isomerase